ncbi:MAG: aspartate racemase [Paraburkholderia sp.]|nr:aspartate racemase [Paraburkholderia sp.]
MNGAMSPGRRSLGVVGGLGALASGDVFSKLVRLASARSDSEHLDVVFEPHPERNGADADADAASVERKLYIYDAIREFEKRGITTVVLPSFVCHTYIDELRENSRIEIADMLEALRAHVRHRFPRACRIGVLSSDYVREQRLFERYFSGPEFEVLHPRPDGNNGPNAVTRAVYGVHGIKAGNLAGRPVELLRETCEDLTARGADVVLTGLTEIGLVVEQLDLQRVPLIDSNLIYAQYVVNGEYGGQARSLKVGVVGGVGPAATVDFMHKIVRNTPATCDQDHIKVLVEQNPQIPDRTENLIGEGPDPTVSLYATCKKLEAGDADIIAIPCNTAHAFVERIQPYLNVPIVNMLTVTVDHLRSTFPALREVGLLATSGTIASGVYQRALEAAGLEQVVPSPALQARVMNAIYGPRGVKAGYTSGECMEDIVAAVDALIERGVEVIILGCTELPLLLPQGERRGASGEVAWLADPTDILAKRCVAYARGELLPEAMRQPRGD